MVEKQRNQTLTRLFFYTCQPFNFKDHISIYLRCIQNQFIELGLIVMLRWRKLEQSFGFSNRSKP